MPTKHWGCIIRKQTTALKSVTFSGPKGLSPRPEKSSSIRNWFWIKSGPPVSFMPTRAYISGEILSRCTFGETNFLLISFFEFNWRPIPILMPFSCSLGSICIIEFHFQIKIQKIDDVNKKFVSPNVHRESISPEM